jgi:hypothetical protein
MAKRRMSTFERLEGGRLNRKQRRELGRQIAAADPGLTIVHANAGGIDVGNESHYVAVPATVSKLVCLTPGGQSRCSSQKGILSGRQ